MVLSLRTASETDLWNKEKSPTHCKKGEKIDSHSGSRVILGECPSVTLFQCQNGPFLPTSENGVQCMGVKIEAILEIYSCLQNPTKFRWHLCDI